MEFNLKVITVVTDTNHEGFKKLEQSLIKHEYDYHVFKVKDINTWENAGNFKIAIDYFNQNTQYTHVLYTDGWDTLATQPQSVLKERFLKVTNNELDRFIYSTEKNFFPMIEDLRSRYTQPTENHRWLYCNNGQHIASINMFKQVFENYNPTLNAQWNAHLTFLNKNEENKILTDVDCEIFQSVAFEDEDEYSFESNTLKNNLLNTYPCFIHGNGRRDLTKFYYNLT